MLRVSAVVCGVFTVGYKNPHHLPVPCAQRWDLRLARAKLWGEHVDAEDTGAYQVEDDRHLSPHFNTFTGFQMRSMRPGVDGMSQPNTLMKKRLPNQTHLELHNRRDVPYHTNAMFGKALYDVTVHGMTIPYYYRIMKDLQKASRNDRKLSGNRFRVRNSQGVSDPPPNFVPSNDAQEGD